MGVKGFLEGLTPNEVWGWAMESARPEQKLQIELYLGTALLAQDMADKPHVGLLASGIGTGHYAFRFALDPAVCETDLSRLTVRAITADGIETDLPRYVPVAAPAPPAAPPVAIAAKTPPAAETHPVFVLGCPRSGTSAVALALVTRTRFTSAVHEGHIIDLLAPLNRVIDRFYEAKSDLISNPTHLMMIREVPRQYFQDGIAALIKDIAERLAPGTFWLDKTPTPQMIRSAPIAAQIWPQAKFIFMRRRGFENLASQQRKYPATTFQQLCERWVDSMFAWQHVAPSLQGRAVEIDQHWLARNPAQAAALISGLLGLNEFEQTEFCHALTLQWPERTDTVADRVYDAMPEGWTEPERQIFNRLCLPYFAQFGYADDGRYYLNDADPGWKQI